MDWTRGPAVGQGSSATVYLATTTSSGHQFAVKSTALSSSALLQKEHALLSNLNSPYLINCLGFDVEIQSSKPPVFNLFMEYLPEGTLWDAIQSNGGRMDESTIGAYSRQILRGLEYLHANGLAHCDIKSRNLLLSGEDLKIADLGCAKLVDGNGVGAFSGSPAFMAPEVARGEEQGFPADVWAFGCTVIEMATGDHPWADMEDPVSALYRIGFSGETPELPRWLSESAGDFVAKCLIKDPKERWTAKRLLEHPFLQRFDSESEIECSKTKRISSSPSCVLDRSFWDSMEDLETPLMVTTQHNQASPSAESPVERIRNLAGNLSSDWDWEGDDLDWILIRNNGVAVDGGSHGNGSVSLDFSGTVEEEEVEMLNLEFEDDFGLFCLSGDDDGGLEIDFESEFMIEPVKFGATDVYCSCSLMKFDLLLPLDLLIVLLIFQNLTNLITVFKKYNMTHEVFASQFKKITNKMVITVNMCLSDSRTFKSL